MQRSQRSAFFQPASLLLGFSLCCQPMAAAPVNDEIDWAAMLAIHDIESATNTPELQALPKG